MDSSPTLDASDDQLAESEINEILKRKRKIRTQLACYPCRQRKVKCNYETPCQRCVERSHPELCVSQRPSKRVLTSQDGADMTSDHATSAPKGEQVGSKLHMVETLLREIKSELAGNATGSAIQGPVTANSEADGLISSQLTATVPETSAAEASAQGEEAVSGFLGDSVHLGSNSVPAMVIALGRGQSEQTVQDLISRSVLPLFGLDNESATYPFIDLWGLALGSAVRLQELCKLIPADADCLNLLRQYRDTAHVLYPGVVDIVQVESDLTQFLVARSISNAGAINTILEPADVYGKDMHWVGLLFACLASGSQCSGISRKEHQLTSQVYVCCAYECLRTVNYLSRATLTDIQTLLVLGNVISNNMNAGVAWSFLGLTIRLAQSLGLHQHTHSSTTSVENHLRDEVWWRIVWQDSLLSITYDRASSTSAVMIHPRYNNPSTGGAELSYVECMKILCKIGLDIVRERSFPMAIQRELSLIIKHRDELVVIMRQASHHLRDEKACKSMKDRLEYWNLYLHTSYVTSELHRSTLKDEKPESEAAANLRLICVDSLADTIDAFLGLQNLCAFARTSWAAIHRALSSALLLVILKEPVETLRIRTLLERFLTLMGEINSSSGPSELPAPVSRSVAALRRLISLRTDTRADSSRPGGDAIIPAVKGQKQGKRPTRGGGESSNSVWYVSESLVEVSPYTIRDRIIWGEGDQSNSFA